MDNNLELISPAFRADCQIPKQYTCKGDNVSPPLNIMNVPGGTKSLALVMHDPDAPVGDYVHWLVWDIPAKTETIAANSVPVGAVQGVNSNGDNKYMGPCPPAGTGTHRYIFELFALDQVLGLPKETGREALEQAMQRKLVSRASLTGIFGAKN